MAEEEVYNAPISHHRVVPHPRRPPAHKSVSLLHSDRSISIPGNHRHRQRANDTTNTNFLAVTSPRRKRAIKGSSSGESSNAEKWFEASNNHIHGGSESLNDNDPPFFLRNSSSSGTPPDYPHEQTPQYRPKALPLHTAGSSSEDFRSVIDDLTVENKKLKRRLKKYENSNDSQLQPDKLFEIRMHGLPPDKKRELEATLRTFAMSLEATPDITSSGTGSNRFFARPNRPQPVSSRTSTKLADSAYASMSGQNTSSQSAQGSNFQKASSPGMLQQQQQNIRSYLDDIPVGLLPRHPVAMSERARRKVVVRRLEQLFAGKGATMDGHQQPLQQEEVAQSAARADRHAIEADGQQAAEEGAREARIVPSATTQDRREIDFSVQNSEATPGGDVQDDTDDDSREQRPTRPLDLDPYRAQVPSDNVEYMRHLGFSPPDVGTTPNLADDHGWIYLNVLTNMAQLHDVNVTLDFVRKAIAEYSSKLELSRDGRKARWKGGSSLTRTSSDGSPTQSSNDSPEVLSKVVGSAKGKKFVPDKSLAAKSPNHMPHKRLEKFAYTPLFSHSQDSTGDSSSDANMSDCGSRSAEDISASRLATTYRMRGDEGAIIFYNGASFCTDLSGDSGVKGLGNGNSTGYLRVSKRPIGLSRQSTISEEHSVGVAEPKGPLSLPTQIPADAMDIDEQGPNEGDLFVNKTSKPASLGISSSEDSVDTVDFEASGIGGVQPTDNFVIKVKSKQQPSQFSTSSTVHISNKIYPSHIQHILAERREVVKKSSLQLAFEAEVISTKRKDLPASTLPPASFYPFFSSLGDDEEADDSDSSSDLSSGPLQTDRSLPATALQLMNWPNLDSSESSMNIEYEEDEDGEEDQSEGSIDMLAHARQADPIMIRAQEREYDSNVAERLAEEIPAGSSAATAGGGSGFNSPESRHNQIPSTSRVMAPPSKRVRANESMVVHPRSAKSPKLE